MWHIYTLEYYSATKRNKTVRFAEMWMDLETVIRSEVNQREKQILCVNAYDGIQKNVTDEPMCKAEIENHVQNKHMDIKQGKVRLDELGDQD